MKIKAQILSEWYISNRRPLPWRSNQDPYKIWISEVMLQQTTVQAVIPYFERFIKAFPNVNVLAATPMEEVLEYWSGLGYYSRAKNLHKAAILISSQNEFPRLASELVKLPGFGPYTSRAVSSIAFNEKVGVLDGNVIRVLTRLFSFRFKWWESKNKEKLQNLSDSLVQFGDPAIINQALMELGATVCTPSSPNCAFCPLVVECKSFKLNLVTKIPLKKPKKANTIWLWKPKLIVRKDEIALIANDYSPFLKKQLIFPGRIEFKKEKPKTYKIKHQITHHEIFVKPTVVKSKARNTNQEFKWVKIKNLKKVNPSSLLQKIIQSALIIFLTINLANCKTTNFSLNESSGLNANNSRQIKEADAMLLSLKEKNSKQFNDLGQLLVKDGINNHPSFSNDGKYVIFDRVLNDKDKPSIYEIRLADLFLKRKTYSDGSSIHPFYSKKHETFYYLSDTDYIKLHPEKISKNSLENSSRFDVFENDALKDSITTKLKTFSSNRLEVNYNNQSEHLIVNEMIDGKSNLSIYNLKNERLERYLKLSKLVTSPIMKDKNNLIWVENGNQINDTKLNLFNILQIDWWDAKDSQILLLTRTDEISSFIIYDISNNCTKLLFSTPLDIKTFSTNMKKIVFSVSFSKELQLIFIKEYSLVDTQNECLPVSN